jgi:protein required for attachment to host cells
MSKLWILVADSSRARIFTTESSKAPLVELKEFDHAESRMHERDLTSDLPGRSYDSVGQGRHDMEPSTAVKEIEAQAFAREVAEYLESSVKQKRCNRLVIAAAPAFLGLLREIVSQRIRSIIRYEFDKNFTQLTAQQIRRLLPERLPMA